MNSEKIYLALDSAGEKPHNKKNKREKLGAFTTRELGTFLEVGAGRDDSMARRVSEPDCRNGLSSLENPNEDDTTRTHGQRITFKIPRFAFPG
ncbi:MAG: hypothetical protein JXB10_14070 [Pirellulales bacterium]|nr:hypothetical protein [Pirellulales bacterium]